MSYIVIRILSGSGTRSQDDLINIAGQELAPQLKKAGCQQYNLIQFADGRMGSVSRYTDKQTAQKANKIAEDWIHNTGAMQGYKIDRALQGERIFGFEQSQTANLDNAYGAIRIYQSKASAEDVKQALEQEATPLLHNAGSDLLRYTCVKLDDGFAMLTAHRTKESATKLTEQAKQAREKSGSLLAKVLTQAPTVIEGQIIRSHT